MKTTLYYFTGTGNSLWVARDLAAKLGDAEIVSMAGLITSPLIAAESERIGFVFPLYYWGLPKIIEEFVRKIDLSRSQYIFYIATPGDASSPCCIGGKIKRLLKGKGKKLDAGYLVEMPGNYIKMYDNDSQGAQEIKYREAALSIARIADRINQGELNNGGDRNGLIAGAVNWWWQSQVNRSDRDFYITDSCNSCGICAKVCPVENITLENGMPVWNHQCQECMACIHFCPKQAIQTKGTAGRGRYRHPEVTIQEIINQKT